jgi:hypothetical protein
MSILHCWECSIQALLSAPNPDDPLAENVAKHWKDNEQEAVATGVTCLLCCAVACLHTAENWELRPVLSCCSQRVDRAVCTARLMRSTEGHCRLSRENCSAWTHMRRSHVWWSLPCALTEGMWGGRAAAVGPPSAKLL